MEIAREPVPVFDFPNTKNKKKIKRNTEKVIYSLLTNNA